MKCQICNKETDWDESYGYENFIVCPYCYNEMRCFFQRNRHKKIIALDVIFLLGKMREKRVDN